MDPSKGGRKNRAMTRTTTTAESPLTDRQREVVALIAAGCSNDEVGRSLGISSRTAKAHSDALRVKLGVARRRQIPAAFRLLTGEDPYVPALVRLRPPRSR
jgi:ATP/maltotriose-dependent transcriptional regulator MalT